MEGKAQENDHKGELAFRGSMLNEQRTFRCSMLHEQRAFQGQLRSQTKCLCGFVSPQSPLKCLVCFTYTRHTVFLGSDFASRMILTAFSPVDAELLCILDLSS